MTSDFEDLLKLFNANAVKDMIVGGHPVVLYTEVIRLGHVDAAGEGAGTSD